MLYVSPFMDGNFEDLLRNPIQLTEAVTCTVYEADLFKQDCLELNEKVEKLRNALRSASNLFSHGIGTLQYDRPARHILVEAAKTLEKTLSIVQRCKRVGSFTWPTNVVPAADFRKVNNLLEGSIGDVTWLLSVSVHGHYGRRGRMEGLPPIASTDPMLAWVWGQIALIISGSAAEQEDAANYLASLAAEDDRNQKLIIEEGGVKAMLMLLNHGTSIGSRLAAANALGMLGTDQERVQQIYEHGAIPVFVQILEKGPMNVQAKVAWAIAKWLLQAPDAASQHPVESIIRPLVLLLTDSSSPYKSVKSNTAHLGTRHSMMALKSLSIVEGKSGCNEISSMNKHVADGSVDDQWETKSTYSEVLLHRRWDSLDNFATEDHMRQRPNRLARNFSDSFHALSSCDLLKKEKENEDPETQRNLKVQVTYALWKLAENNVKSCRRIASARGLVCFAKLMEKEMGEVLRNSVMAVMEMAVAAERDVELRKFSFKPNSVTAKAVLDQLLRLVQVGGADLQIPCLKAIGCLSRTFPAKETKAIIELCVCRLAHPELDVAAEAALALQKFSNPDNFLHLEHSKTIVDANAIPHLVQLVLSHDEDVQVPAVILLSHLAVDAGNHDGFRTTATLKTLKTVARSSISQIQSVKEVLSMALQQLELSQAAPPTHPHNNYY